MSSALQSVSKVLKWQGIIAHAPIQQCLHVMVHITIFLTKCQVEIPGRSVAVQMSMHGHTFAALQ